MATINLGGISHSATLSIVSLDLGDSYFPQFLSGVIKEHAIGWAYSEPQENGAYFVDAIPFFSELADSGVTGPLKVIPKKVSPNRFVLIRD